jgi:hypothetical protein
MTSNADFKRRVRARMARQASPTPAPGSSLAGVAPRTASLPPPELSSSPMNTLSVSSTWLPPPGRSVGACASKVTCASRSPSS